MKPAVAYLRVSGQDQLHGDGLDRQEIAVREYAKLHDYQIVAVYSEEGVSGKTVSEHRPAMSQMMADAAAAQETPVILIEKVDRLARDLMVQEGFIDRCHKLGIEIVSTMEPDLCSTDPSRKFIRQVFGAVAELDRSLLVAKLGAARARIRARGQRCGGAYPFGWEHHERPVLDMMIKMREEGKTLTYITDYLNKNGFKSKRNCQWYPMTVLHIIDRARKTRYPLTRPADK